MTSSDGIVSAVELDFMDALRMVIDGQKITRLEWDDPASYIVLRGGFLCIAQEGVVNRLLVSDGDLLALDWVVLEAAPILIN